MTGKYKNYKDCDGLNSILTIALLEIYSMVDIDPKGLALALDVHISTIHKSIGKKRQYPPSIPMVQCLLEIFEDLKPGSRRYYGLRIAGAGKAIAEKKAYGEVISKVDSESDLDDENFENLDFELSNDVEETIESADEFTSCEILIACLNRHFSEDRDEKVRTEEIIEEIDFDVLFNIFYASYKKSGFTRYLTNKNVPKSFAESLVFSGLNLGASIKEIGANLTHHEFGELILGFSPNLVSQSDLKKTDAKSLETRIIDHAEQKRKLQQNKKNRL